MTYVIFKQDHPLDAIWSQAVEAVSDAQHAVENQPNDFDDADNDRLKGILLDAISVVVALPARNVSDALYKLDLTGIGEDGPLLRFDQHEIMREAFAVIDADIARGRKLKTAFPDFLEGVAL